MRALFALLFVVVAGSALACAQVLGIHDTGDSGAGSDCSNVGGAWAVTGTCTTDSCTVVQADDCSIMLTCNEGTARGMVTGSDVSFSGSETDQSQCNGSLSGNTVSGTCNLNGSTCDFSAGLSGGSGSSSGGGTGSSSGGGSAAPTCCTYTSDGICDCSYAETTCASGTVVDSLCASVGTGCCLTFVKAGASDVFCDCVGSQVVSAYGGTCAGVIASFNTNDAGITSQMASNCNSF